MVAVYLVEFAAFGSPEGYGVALAPLIAHLLGGPVRRAAPGLAGAGPGCGPVGRLDGLRPAERRRWPGRVGTAVWLAPWVIAWLVGAAGAHDRDVPRAAPGWHGSTRVRAVVEERNRIARELHDVIGHSVSVMTVQACAVRRRLRPDQAVEREALETVEDVGREALAEMRRMVAVLRGDDG